MAFRTRIRAVRFKSGGEVRVLPSAREAVSADLFNELTDIAAQVWERNAGKVAGFALVVWTADHDVAAHVNNGETSPHPVSVLPAMCEGSVRRVITKVQVNRLIGRDKIKYLLSVRLSIVEGYFAGVP